MEKEFAEHSGIPEIIEKFRVIFEQSKGNCKQLGVDIWQFQEHALYVYIIGIVWYQDYSISVVLFVGGKLLCRS